MVTGFFILCTFFAYFIFLEQYINSVSVCVCVCLYICPYNSIIHHNNLADMFISVNFILGSNHLLILRFFWIIFMTRVSINDLLFVLCFVVTQNVTKTNIEIIFQVYFFLYYVGLIGA